MILEHWKFERGVQRTFAVLRSWKQNRTFQTMSLVKLSKWCSSSALEVAAEKMLAREWL